MAAHAGACEAERQLLRSRFGVHAALEPASKPWAVRADFNGDGTTDVAMLVRIASEPAALPPAIARINPLKRAGAWTGQRRSLAIAISLEGSSPKLFLMADQEFFATPMWQSPVDLLTKISKTKAPRRAQGDALGVATESGADMVIFCTTAGRRAEATPDQP